MADQKMSSFPWGSIAVLLAFVASTQLVPRAFDALRPAEKERVQPPVAADLPVDARMWEDPFVAVRRFEAERNERCKLAPKEAPRPAECVPDELSRQRNPATLLEHLDRDDDHDLAETLVVTVLVPGNPFVGAEESRRRVRYALLAGLQSKEYVPDNPERIGLLQFDLMPQEAGPAPAPAASAPAAFLMAEAVATAPVRVEPPRLLVPYELLSERRLIRGDEPRAKGTRYAQIAVLWIDEAALPVAKLDSLAQLVAQLFNAPTRSGCPPRLAVIGPSSTDSLRVALADLTRASSVVRSFASSASASDAYAADARCADGRRKLAQDAGNDTRRGYAYLAQAEIVNTAATAPGNQIEELKDQRLESFINERFSEILGQHNTLEVNYRRTIALDNEVLRSLVAELELRFPPDQRRRVVLVAERDSLYSQALVTELRYRMRGQTTLDFEVVYFFRGLDGVTTRDGADKSAASNKAASAEAAIEWPESRDQLDYLRRMAESLKRSEAGGRPIGAIGILGNDVHDKLLVLQALHDTFSDKVFFTTDMDARFLHPRARAFTRNLIVASSLPLEFPRAVSRDSGGPLAPGQASMVLQAGTPPLRDAYQSSMYLAARRLGSRDDGSKDAEGRIADWALKNPSVYEIGRTRALPLAGYAALADRGEPPASRAVAGIGLAALLLGGLLVWPSTPALRAAGEHLLRRRSLATAQPLSLPCVAIVALHFALLAFALASLIEFVEPGHMSFIYILLLAALSALVAVIALYPRVGVHAGAAAPFGLWHGWSPARLLLIAGATIGWVWIAWPSANTPDCMHCEPVAWLQGVSAWPSHLIHLIALVAIAVALDYSWSHTLRSLPTDSAWLRVPMPRADAPLLRGLARYSVAAWRRPKDDDVDFESLWHRYVHLGGSGPRAVRTLLWYAVTLVVVTALFLVFSDGDLPEVPVRGTEHRQLVAWTLYATLLLLPLLVVAVADATVLVVRFVGHLNSHRTAYPPETVAAFARSLGSEHAALWVEPIAADPAERQPLLPGAPPPRHTLLDDWIDVQVVARRTQVVAPLVIGPFVVLALLIVARSRLFDNWSLTLPIALAASAYLLWLVLLASLLKITAERARRCALLRMNADLRWLAGAGAERGKLVEPFKRLIAAVEVNQTGAFAPFFDQPLFKAILVPLGGVGGTKLFDYLLLGQG